MPRKAFLAPRLSSPPPLCLWGFLSGFGFSHARKGALMPGTWNAGPLHIVKSLTP